MLIKVIVICFFIALTSLSAHADGVSVIDEQLQALDLTLKQDLQKGLDDTERLSAFEPEMSDHQRAYFLVLKGVTNLLHGDYRQSLLHLEHAQLIATDQQLVNRIYLYQITAFMALKQYPKAFTTLEQNLTRLRASGNVTIQLETYVRAMNIYLDIDAYEDSKLIAEKILFLNQGNNPQIHCYGLVGLSFSLLSLQQFDAAQAKLIETQTYCNQHNLSLIGAMAVKGQAMVNIEKRQYAQAEQQLAEALGIYHTFKFAFELARAEALLAQVYFNMGEYETAKEYAQKVNLYSNEPSFIEPKKEANDILSIIASKQGHYEQAYQFQVMAYALGNQLIDELKVKQNAYQLAKFNHSEQQVESEALQQDHQELVKQKNLFIQEKSSSTVFLTVLGGVSLCLLLLLIAAWVQRNRFRDQAQQDGLTGIFNRRAGQELAESEFALAKHNGYQYVVMLFDLDYFKSVNDRFGHATGDWVLKRVTELISQMIREGDIFSRMGGEEFSLFLTHMDMNVAYELAETIRIAVGNIDTSGSGHQFKVTVSIGICEMLEEDTQITSMLHRADLALYQSKRQGRNCVMLSQNVAPV